MESKTIIISSQDNNSRGILTFFIEDDLLKCKIRLYNNPSLNRYCKLGVYHQKEVYSANLLEKDGAYSSSFVGDFDIEKDFYTAIIDTSKNNQVILSGGTYSGYFSNNNVFSNIAKENPNTDLFEYDEEIENAINFSINNVDESSLDTNKEQNCEENCERCSHCKYKEYFYSQQSKLDSTDDILNEENINFSFENKQEETKVFSINQNEEKEQEKKQEHRLIDSIVPQFEYVFENYTPDNILNNLIPNGKFVKINENSDSYSIGAIYEENEMKFICYAVPRDYNSPAPQELGKHYQWIPLDKEDPLSEGYYIVFQDANDLKIVEM